MGRANCQRDGTKTRVELHVHTCYSAMDALIKPRELVQRAAQWGMNAVAATDHGGVQAFPELWKAGKEYGVKIIYGIEGYFVDNTDGSAKGKPVCHICLLAKNKQGLKDLYRIVSTSHTQYYDRANRRPIIPKSLLQGHREGLLIGSACAEGELYRAILRGRSQEELERIASFYDYLEIMPIGNNRFLVENGTVRDDEALREINRRIVALGMRMGKTVAATCDAHFLEPSEETARRILLTSDDAPQGEHEQPLYFRATEEVFAEFSYLGEKTCREVVIDGPRKIADQVEEVDPLPEKPCLPKPENSKEELKSLVSEGLRRIYGDMPPACVSERVDAELDIILRYDYDVVYLTAKKLAQGSLENGYPVGIRGSVGSSLVAYLSGITEINPLPPHYVCPNCKHVEFITDSSYGCGLDLPDKFCPVCGGTYRKEGFAIPMETFFGVLGEEKFPNIDLIFADEYKDRAVEQLREMFGKDRVLRADAIGKVTHGRAYDMVEGYLDAHQITVSKIAKERLVTSLEGVKRTTDCWPSYFIIPEGVEITDLCPVQWTGKDPSSSELAPHFDFQAMNSSLLRLGLLGHNTLSMLRMLQALTGIDPRSIPLDDPDTMSLFTSSDILGYTDNPFLGSVGTVAVPEFDTAFTRQMLAETLPRNFSDLVRLSGFSHGTDVWWNNAHDLILNGKVALSETVSCRDDIMLYLIQMGVEPKTAFKIMEAVRKGKVRKSGFQDGWVETMKEHGVPDWYIESLVKISYLFPKAHAVAHVMMAIRIAWFKVHYPLAFYATYFTISPAKCFLATAMHFGADVVKSIMQKIFDKGACAEKRYLWDNLEVCYEFYLRGFDLVLTEVSCSGSPRFHVNTQTRFQIVDDQRLTLITAPM